MRLLNNQWGVKDSWHVFVRRVVESAQFWHPRKTLSAFLTPRLRGSPTNDFRDGLIICVWSLNDCPSLSAIMARRRTGVTRKACGSFFTRPDYIIIKCEENAKNFSIERRAEWKTWHFTKCEVEMFIFNLFFIWKFSINASCFRLPLRRPRQAKTEQRLCGCSARSSRGISELCQHVAISGKSHVSIWY